MSTIGFYLNGRELVTAGGAMLSSIDWDLTASRYEDAGALLRVSALRNRSDGHYDCLHFADDVLLAEGSALEVRWAPGEATSPIARIETHEQAEALRLKFTEQMDCAETESRNVHSVSALRVRSALEVNIEGFQKHVCVAEDPVELVVCHGFWAPERKPSEWNIRLSRYPSASNPSGAWYPVEKGVYVSVRA
jgi:hypothetical protein